MEYGHVPVLLAEVLQQLNLSKGCTVVDCTLGGAGHTGAILKLIAPVGILVGIDLDEEAINKARETLARFSQQTHLVKGNFKDIDKILENLNLGLADGILFDLGLSSAQVDNPTRGFSYSCDCPLDMRMDKRGKLTAAEVVNEYSEEKLASILERYGEERWASRIAHFIVSQRVRKAIKTSFELVKVIKEAIPASARRRGGHPAKRTFQALRIEVNEELANLKKGLLASINWLKPEGRMVVISYHSLEDRIVKDTFKDLAKGCICPPTLPECRCGRKPLLKILTKVPIRATEEEIRVNPRAKGARLRAAEKI